MTDTTKTTQHLSAFKQARDAAVHADAGELSHHLMEFVKEVHRNPLCKQVLATLPSFDVDPWLKEQIGDERQFRRLTSLTFPEDPNHKLAALWDLTSSMGSGKHDLLSVQGFGQLFGAYKNADAAHKAISFVIRPFADMMTDRLREQAKMADPNLRELAGVPLAAIPGENETRVFLSHRSADKTLVRPYFDVLQELGFQPWLDEHDMPAGTTLHRGISAGMDSSCAVVFFVTRNFEDERWLAREVDHAINRKVELADKFAVITLVFEDADVPRPLRDVVWHNVKGEADALWAIVRALPIELGPPRWKARIYKK